MILRDDGSVDRIVVPPRLDAHRLIEEFMIQANVAAAETLEAKKSPLVYRIHDEPSFDKLEALRDFLGSLDMSFPKAGSLRPSQFNRVLERVAETPNALLVNEVILRSQSQAEYAVENIGHFGLNLRRYVHFTSPIRRYADLLVHRALIAALALGPGGLRPQDEKDLDRVAGEISIAERRAMAAERDTVDRLIALLARRAHRRAFPGPHPRRHARRPVRRADGERRRRLRADLDDRRGFLRVSGGAPSPRRPHDRRDVPAWRCSRGEARRSPALCRQPAARAPARGAAASPARGRQTFPQAAAGPQARGKAVSPDAIAARSERRRTARRAGPAWPDRRRHGSDRHDRRGRDRHQPHDAACLAHPGLARHLGAYDRSGRLDLCDRHALRDAPRGRHRRAVRSGECDGRRSPASPRCLSRSSGSPTSVGWMFPIMFVYGGCIALCFTLSEFWIAAKTPDRSRGFVIGLYATLLSLGFAVGPAVIAALGVATAYPFLIGSALMILAALPAFLARRSSPVVHERPKVRFSTFIFAAPVATLGAFAFAVGETGGFAFLPLWGDRLGFSPATAALLISAMTLGNVAFQIPLGILADRMDRRLLLLACGAAGALGMLIAWSVSDFAARACGGAVPVGRRHRRNLHGRTGASGLAFLRGGPRRRQRGLHLLLRARHARRSARHRRRHVARSHRRATDRHGSRLLRLRDHRRASHRAAGWSTKMKARRP